MSSTTNGRRGAYGMQKVAWKTVIDVLKEFGAQEKRRTAKHGSILYRLPNEYHVAIGNPNKRDKYAMDEAIRQLMSEVSNAGIHPKLFLASLNRGGGAAWYRLSPEIQELTDFLKKDDPDLRNPSEWRNVLHRFRKGRLEARKKQASKEQASSPEGTPTEEKRYTVTDVIELAGIEGPQAKSARVLITKNMKSEHGLMGRMVAEGKAWRHVPEGGKRGRSYFTEQGALITATWIADKYEREPTLRSPEEPQKEAHRDTSSVPTTKPSERSPGADIIFLTSHHGTTPVWDGYTVDTAATIARIVDTITGKEE